MTDTCCAAEPALAEAAARLLGRLRDEPLPADEGATAALARATRSAFLLLEETRLLAGASNVVAFPGPRKDRTSFFEPETAAADGEDRTVLGLAAFRTGAAPAAVRDRRRA